MLWWVTRPDLDTITNALNVGLTICMAAVYAVIAWLRRRSFRRPVIWDPGDIALFGLLPVLPAAPERAEVRRIRGGGGRRHARGLRGLDPGAAGRPRRGHLEADPPRSD